MQGSSRLFIKQVLLPASTSWEVFLKASSWQICNSQQVNLIFSCSFFAAMTFSCSSMLVFGFSPCSSWLQPTVKQELLETWSLRPELWLHSWRTYLCLCSKFFDLDCIFPLFLEMGLNIAPKQKNNFHSNSSLIQHFLNSAFESKRENGKKGKGHINIKQSQSNDIE